MLFQEPAERPGQVERGELRGGGGAGGQKPRLLAPLHQGGAGGHRVPAPDVTSGKSTVSVTLKLFLQSSINSYHNRPQQKDKKR